MTNEQIKVREFMLKFSQQVADKPSIPSLEIRKLRAKLILEEALEIIEALGLVTRFDFDNYVDPESIVAFVETGNEPNLIGIADGLADLDYVAKGTALACGLDMEAISAEVHRSNMSKLWTEKEIFSNMTISTWHHTRIGDTDRFLVTDRDGKIIKSPSYSPANLQPIIDDQTNIALV